MEFPENFFHLRHALFSPFKDALPEPEIYTRLLETMGILPKKLGFLSKIASIEPEMTARMGYFMALKLFLSRQPKLQKYATSILYRTLGKTLPKGLESAAPAIGFDNGLRAKILRCGEKRRL